MSSNSSRALCSCSTHLDIFHPQRRIFLLHVLLKVHTNQIDKCLKPLPFLQSWQRARAVVGHAASTISCCGNCVPIGFGKGLFRVMQSVQLATCYICCGSGKKNGQGRLGRNVFSIFKGPLSPEEFRSKH